MSVGAIKLILPRIWGKKSTDETEQGGEPCLKYYIKRQSDFARWFSNVHIPSDLVEVDDLGSRTITLPLTTGERGFDYERKATYYTSLRVKLSGVVGRHNNQPFFAGNPVGPGRDERGQTETAYQSIPLTALLGSHPVRFGQDEASEREDYNGIKQTYYDTKEVKVTGLVQLDDGYTLTIGKDNIGRYQLRIYEQEVTA